MFTESDLNTFVNLIRKDAANTSIAHGLRGLNVNPGNVQQVNQVIGSLETMARNGGMRHGRQALEAIEVMSRDYPEAVRRLGSLARSTAGKGAMELRAMANEALNRVSTHHPETYMDELAEIARRGGEAGKSAFDIIAQAAQHGSAHGRQLLERMAQRGGDVARQASRVLQQLGAGTGAAVTGAGAAISSAGSTVGAGITAAVTNPAIWGLLGVMTAAGLAAGYYWSQAPMRNTVQAGDRQASAYVTPAADQSSNGYYVVLVKNRGWQNNGILSVRSAASIENGIPYRYFSTGGMSDEKAELEKIGPMYASESEAKQAARKMISEVSFIPMSGQQWLQGKRGGVLVYIDSVLYDTIRAGM